MADLSTTAPLTRASVQTAHDRIKPYIHHTGVTTNATISALASRAQTEEAEALRTETREALEKTQREEREPKTQWGKREPKSQWEGEEPKSQWEGKKPARPKIRVLFKHENEQKIGAFKARGAFHALGRVMEVLGEREVRRRGVVTHSSGNHAQALALAAKTFNIPAHIVMPSISTPSKIAGTQSHGANVVFSGSTAPEREAVVAEIQEKTNAILIPPYDHPDIILGQGTLALELEAQAAELLASFASNDAAEKIGVHNDGASLDAVIAPCGGGGMLSGVATALHGTGIRVFGAEPSFQGADDALRGLRSGTRITSVKTLTIADGLRTPLGGIPFSVLSDKDKLSGMYAVSEEQIKEAMRLLLERAKIFVEPSAAVALAVVLFNEEFRDMVQRVAGERGWNVGVVLSGGNTTVDAIAKLFAPEAEVMGEREEGVVGMDGVRVAENVAG
ncbi:pyridoxal-phosphate dependent enzyme-domain-containing protein [Delphinella strobiligena]|nr:pyridoxal-phosphate dependent enzyme-domain-containing protein [Delphinella strobiligena]